MISIRPNCVQNIRTNLSKTRFKVSTGSRRDKSNPEPVIRTIRKITDMKKVMYFFFNSFKQTASAVMNGDRYGKIGKIIDWYTEKQYTFSEMLKVYSKNSIIETIEQKDKMLGCYHMDIDNKNKDLYICFMAINPEIKDSKMSVKTLLNTASRILEHAKANNIKTISWHSDPRNIKAYRLFDKFPAAKSDDPNLGSKFVVDIKDFEETLNQYKI